MTEIRLTKLKFKEGGKESWGKWCKEILNREEEALATLKKEGVIIESCFTDGEHMYILMIAESLSKASESVKMDPHPIDLDHRKNMQLAIEIPDKNPDLELLFHLDRSSIDQ